MSQQQPDPIRSPSEQVSADGKFSKACASCRARKVRCVPQASSTSKTCMQCARAARECVYTIPSKTRRRKRTDTRVTELEKQVEAMGAALKRHRESVVSESYAGGCISGEGPLPSGDLQTKANGSVGSSIDSGLPSDVGGALYRGLLSMEEASRLLTRYETDLLPHFPLVILPEGATVDQMQQEKPILLLAVLTAATQGVIEAKTSLQLNHRLHQLYADRVTMNGERSLELVQSILVTSTWFCPPDAIEKMKFYQYLHMAWSMLMDLGLDKKSKLASVKTQGNGILGSGHLEKRRTLLSCWLMCSLTALSLRRPSMVRFSKLMAESVDMLEASPDAAPTDRKLCAWVRLQRIMEQWVLVADVDELTPNAYAEPRFQYTLRDFERQLEDWRQNIAAGIMDDSLTIFYHVCLVYLHETAMYVDHDAEDFQPPFMVKRVTREAVRGSLPPAYLDGVSILRSSAQALLNKFLQFDFDTLQALPATSYVRANYGVIMLTKLAMSAIAPNSPLGVLMSLKDIQAAPYQDKILTHLTCAIGPKRNRVALKFAVMLFKLRSWFMQNGTATSTNVKGEEQIAPGSFMGPEHDPFTNPTNSNNSANLRQPFQGAMLSAINPPEASQTQDPMSMPAELTTDQIESTMNADLFVGDTMSWMADNDFDNLFDFSDDIEFEPMTVTTTI